MHFQERDLEQDLMIDESNLAQEYATYPAILNYWLRMLALAEAESNLAQQACSVKKSQEYLLKRAQNSGKGKTVKEIEAEVDASPGTQAAVQAETEAKKRHQMMKAAAEAMKSKLNCLISLGAHQRAELESLDPHMRSRNPSYRPQKAHNEPHAMPRVPARSDYNSK